MSQVSLALRFCQSTPRDAGIFGNELQMRAYWTRFLDRRMSL